MTPEVKILVGAAAYGAVVAIGAVWMMWLKHNVASDMLQGGLFTLWLLPATVAAGRTLRIGTKHPQK